MSGSVRKAGIAPPNETMKIYSAAIEAPRKYISLRPIREVCSGLRNDQFCAGERLGVARAAFHSAQPGKGEKRLLVPPVTAALRRIAFVEQFDLAARYLVAQREIRVGPGQVAVPLRHLVAQVKLVS